MAHAHDEVDDAGSEGAELAMSGWTERVSPSARHLYDHLGFGTGIGLGHRPALLVVDVQVRTCGSPSGSTSEAEDLGGINHAQVALPHIAKVLDLGRSVGLPVLFAYVAEKTTNDSHRLRTKMPRLFDVPSAGYDFVPGVEPEPHDILVPKRHPSAFFGTPLSSYLTERGIDSLVVIGCMTSGCVRATVTDAFSLGYRVIVPEEAVFDRDPDVHAYNLFDMNAKFGDVLPLAQVMHELSHLPAATSTRSTGS